MNNLTHLAPMELKVHRYIELDSIRGELSEKFEGTTLVTSAKPKR
jgi:hypothetical protein